MIADRLEKIKEIKNWFNKKNLGEKDFLFICIDNRNKESIVTVHQYNAIEYFDFFKNYYRVNEIEYDYHEDSHVYYILNCQEGFELFDENNLTVEQKMDFDNINYVDKSSRFVCIQEIDGRTISGRRYFNKAKQLVTDIKKLTN